MPTKAAPKVKKSMEEPPAAATRSHDAFPGEHLGSTAAPSPKRAADVLDGGEDDEVPPKDAPKVKKAMNKPPAAATRSHDAFPGEHLKSRAASSHKRAADTSEGEESDAEVRPSGSKAAKPKKPKAAAAGDHTKPSKLDGHPVETKKTHPGGDMVEVEPSTEQKPRKAKKSKEKQSEPAEPTDSGKSRKSKLGKGGKEAPDAVNDKEPNATGEDSAVEASASSKPKKVKKGDAKKTPALKPGRPPKTKVTKATEKEQKADTKDGENESAAPEPTKKAKKSKKATKGADSGNDRADAQVVEVSATTTPSKGGKKAKKPAENDGPEDDDATVAPDVAMDESVFDSLLSTDKEKQPAHEVPAPEDSSKTPKAAKKNAKGQAKDDASSKDNVKPAKKGKATDKSADDTEQAPSKTKKRKSPPSGDADAVKADILEPMSEAASAKKKQRKSGSSALGAAGDSLGSLLSSVKKNAKAAIEFAGNAANGGESSVMGSAKEVAEGLVEDREKQRKKSNVPKEEIQSEESLLKGMESSADEEDPDEDEGFEVGKLPPPLPQSAFDKINARSDPDNEHKSGEGVVYVGRIPHGFYEHEMRAYFGQFGHINRLRLSRNKTTGASRHFAFIEFDSTEVAKIVEETMNNYLLFGHILKVKSLNSSRVDPKIWKGANRRFKKVPWAQIEGRKLAAPMSREQWEKRVENEQKRRTQKAEKMKEIGYDFESSLKSVDQVPVKEDKKAINEDDEGVVLEEEKTLVTEPGEDGGSMIILKESITVKKPRKPSAKAKEIENSKDAAVPASKKGKRKAGEALEKVKESTNIAEPVQKKARKGKAKADEATNQVSDAVKDVAEPVVEKAKDTIEDVSEKAKPVVNKAMKTVEEASEKAKGAVENVAPVAKKGKNKAEKIAEDVVAPTLKRSKKSGQDATEKVVNSAAPVVQKAKEVVEEAAEAIAKATGISKKGSKAKA